jgi:hypothetical protein
MYGHSTTRGDLSMAFPVKGGPAALLETESWVLTRLNTEIPVTELAINSFGLTETIASKHDYHSLTFHITLVNTYTHNLLLQSGTLNFACSVYVYSCVSYDLCKQ